MTDGHNHPPPTQLPPPPCEPCARYGPPPPTTRARPLRRPPCPLARIRHTRPSPAHPPVPRPAPAAPRPARPTRRPRMEPRHRPGLERPRQGTQAQAPPADEPRGMHTSPPPSSRVIRPQIQVIHAAWRRDPDTWPEGAAAPDSDGSAELP
jgi:hypothetical protein